MTYKELCQIADKRINTTQIGLPVDAYTIATTLGIRVKNSIEAKQDFGDSNNPLLYSNGCIAITKGEYVIYHDEKSPYRNFIIAHEIAHYLLNHLCDGVVQHHDANLLASIIIAPKRLILINAFNNAAQLSTTCMIPFEVANEYWSELKSDEVITDSSSSLQNCLHEIQSRFVDIVKLLDKVGGAMA